MPDAPSREFTSLVRQLARLPSSATTLREAHLDCAAVTLHLHPFVVDATRSFLDATEGWAGLDALFDGLKDAAPPGADLDLLLEGESAEACTLIERAEADGRGTKYLCEGDPGEVAATYGVHPYVVFRARGALERKALCTKQK